MMSIEILKEQVEAILESGDGIQLHQLLDDQNISDVADLVDDKLCYFCVAEIDHSKNGVGIVRFFRAKKVI